MSKKQAKKENGMRNEVIGVLCIAFALLIFASLFGFRLGPLGTMVERFLLYGFGKGSFLIACLFIATGIRYIFTAREKVFTLRYLFATLFFLNLLFLYHQYVSPPNSELLPANLTNGGGILSGLLVFAFRKILGVDGTWIFLCATTLCFAIISFKLSLKKTAQKAGEGIEELKVVAQKTHSQLKKASVFNYEKVLGKDEMQALESRAEEKKYLVDDDNEILENLREKITALPAEPEQEINFPLEAAEEELEEEVFVEKPPLVEVKKVLPEVKNNFSLNGEYSFPQLNLLKQPKKAKTSGGQEEAAEQAAILEQTLADFKVNAKIVNIVNGPSVTRFEVEPAPGVKVNKIASLVDDLTLRLKVSGIRIENSIPGKSAMGIEVPKKTSSPVTFYDVAGAEEFTKSESKLSVALGKDITGKTIVADISKMPHVLVAGSTGSGKSVCINTLVNSILFKASPEEVKFIMIDPKVVELSTYNGIPHLLVPVVTNPKKAAGALFWAVEEMEKRYQLFAETGVREITRYNTIAEEKIPFIVIIIDELADLMMVAPGDVEDAICRLAQKARAAGLHLILATQRPSVDVITGIIKANIPSRIAFAVSSQIDSRTILDSSGAEKLLGKGDMLYYPVGLNKPLRLQGAFISDEEIENITGYIKQQAIPVEYTEDITEHALPSEKKTEKNSSSAAENPNDRDELLEQALEIIYQTGQASASMLQRRLRIGYTRAARLVDVLAETGVVGPATGTSKPRDILLSEVEAQKVLGFIDLEAE